MKNESIVEKIKGEALDVIEKNRGNLIEISHTIHDNPEVGLQEYKASELLTSELKKHGFTVKTRVAGMKTAFLATYQGKPGGPSLGILAEYDALGGVGHGCGHNIIGTAAIAAAIGISKVMPQLKGKITVFGTPNEEGGSKGGKIPMVEEGLFKNVDAAIMIHPSRSTREDVNIHPRYRSASEEDGLALCGVEIRFKGKSSHAAASPELGINALDAVIQTYNGINALRQHIKSDSRIHGIITNGGKAPNVVPDEASAYFYVRAGETDYLWELMEKVKHCAEGAALATGATLEFNQEKYHMEPVKQNETLAELLMNNLISLGERVEEPEKEGGRGSTDMGNVSQVIPATCTSIAIAPKSVTGHSKEMAKAAASDAGDRGIILGAKTMALTCIDLFTDTKLLQKAKEEFKKRK